MTTNADAFGSLTAPFTSGQGASDGAGEHAPREAQLITLLVGNVPVMAGLWTTQYADEVGRHHGPTALVRYERDEVTVELLRAEIVRGMGLIGCRKVSEINEKHIV